MSKSKKIPKSRCHTENKVKTRSLAQKNKGSSHPGYAENDELAISHPQQKTPRRKT